MRKSLVYAVFFFLMASYFHLAAQNPDSLIIRKIYTKALSDPVAYRNLDYLCNKIGGRLCGSVQAEKAVQWAKFLLEAMNLDSVYLQPVTVEHWERGGKEIARVTSAQFGKHFLHVCAIGGSVGTGKAGITADVVEVKNFEELKILGRSQIEGKIVFFDRAADPAPIYTFDAYGGAVDQRARGAMQAARFGAVAVIVRSATPAHDNYPHTGNQHYADSVKAIPAISVSTNDADSLSAWLLKDPGLKLFLQMSCSLYPQTNSYNVVGEIHGNEYPNEIIAFGGHLDSWDIGQGAHDDGAGVVQTIDVLRLFKTIGMKPRHTIRVVLFMDEEYSQRGAKTYSEEAKKLSESGREKHIAAIEADRGGFTPQGFSIEATGLQVKQIMDWEPLLISFGLWSIGKGGSGVDIRDLKSLGVPLIALVTDSQRYFDYHHCAADTFDKVNVRELQLGSAALTSLVWLIDSEW